MKERSISAIGVVLVGLVPAFFGGIPFALVFTLLLLVGGQEYVRLAVAIGKRPRTVGFLAIPVATFLPLWSDDVRLLGACVLWALIPPMIASTFSKDQESVFADWALSGTGALALGITGYAAVSLRVTDGDIDAAWLRSIDSSLSLGWDNAPRGLAWLLSAIVVSWLCDTGAYLGGRTFGKRPLIPHISPKKTVEGLVVGLACASLTGGLAFTLFGLPYSFLLGLAFGLVVGGMSVYGDLAESVMKRQAGVKDSGSLIPGHGGMLDRLDGLLYAIPTAWLLAALIERVG